MSAPWDWREVPDVVAAVEAATLGAAQAAAVNRPRLGASQIGIECERRLWWEFRHGGPPTVSARGHRAAARGTLQEVVFLQELERAGLRPEHGYNYAALGGHFGGTADVVVRVPPGLSAALKLPAGEKIMLDCKDLNHRRFLELRRKGPRLFEEGRYWAQVQAYLHLARESGHLSGIEWGALYCADKNEEARAFYLFPFSPAAAAALLEKAARVIESDYPPPRSESRAEAFACKFCPAAAWCWRGAPLASNCRTCAHFLPQSADSEYVFAVEPCASHHAIKPAWTCELDRPWHLGPCAAHHPADAEFP